MGHPAHADVTVCIPAWRAAAFIDRTIRCARNQTHDAQRITVSIDLSDDATEEICRSHARKDERVEVHAHRERLGWARNVNFLLDRVDTEFGFLYFHDDVIEPTYNERLVGALRERPDAASAHCDVELFGGTDRKTAARGYEGSSTERLLEFLVEADRGSLLRSMFRTALVGADLRLPTGSDAGIWAHQPFVMKLVAAGPVLRVGETLYRRWDKREGGLTDRWRSLPLEEIVEAHRMNAEAELRIIDGLHPSPAERERLIFGLFVSLTRRLRRAEVQYDASSVIPPERLLPEFAGMILPPAVRELPNPLREWCEEAYDLVQRQTGKRALQVGDFAQATASFKDLTRRHPRAASSWARLAEALHGTGRIEEAQEARRTARRLRRERAEPRP